MKKTKTRKKKLHLQWVDEVFEVTVKRRPASDTRFVRKHPAAVPIERQAPIPSV